MSPPDGARTKLPPLSWDSVVDAGPPSDTAMEPSSEPVDASDAVGITLTPITLDLGLATSPDVGLGALASDPLGTDSHHLDFDEPLAVRTTPPAVIVPALGDVISGPDSLTPPSLAASVSAPAETAAPTTAPPAVEAPPAPTPRVASPPVATPPAAAPAVPSAPSAAPTTSANDTSPAVHDVAPAIADAVPAVHDAAPAVHDAAPAVHDVAPAVHDVAPAVHDVAPASDALPVIQEATSVDVSPVLPSLVTPAATPAPRSTSAPSFDFDPASVAPAHTPQPHRRTKHTGLKLLAVLLVLGGLIAGALVFGQPYLFPADWDDTTAPYAEAVEIASGVEFDEPFSIVAEPAAEFGARLQAQSGPASPEELAQWRALGLATGPVDDATLAGQLAGWQSAVYSTIDGQVYHDADAAGRELDAQLTQQVAAASLDQQYGWSTAQARRTLDAAAATTAEVLRQARTLQQASTFSGATPPVPSELVDALPPVVGYRLLAPHVFAEFDGAIDATESNPLADLGTAGPGHLGRATPAVAASPTMLDGDVATGTPVAKDRSFWYLVFAGYLDARTARDASEAVVESALTAATRGATQCVSATFSGTGVEQTATLRSALEAWAATVPVEMAGSFQVLPDGTLQLVSCDPGAGFDARTRPGVARELLAWRMAELATLEAATYSGGGDSQFLDGWAFVSASPMALELMTLPPATPPTELAVAARAGFAALLAPAG